MKTGHTLAALSVLGAAGLTASLTLTPDRACVPAGTPFQLGPSVLAALGSDAAPDDSAVLVQQALSTPGTTVTGISGNVRVSYRLEEDPTDGRPILIKVVGAVADTATSPGPGRVVLADICADGSVDRGVAFYGEAGGDWQVIYYGAFMYRRPGVIAFRGQMATTGYRYLQEPDQWSTAFSAGSEIWMGFWDAHERAFQAINEAPFCFFGPEIGGPARMAIRLERPQRVGFLRNRLPGFQAVFERLSGAEPVATLRLSLDIDRDARPGPGGDYDASISAVGPRSDGDRSAPAPIPGLPLVSDGPSCAEALDFSENAGWRSVGLTWDEDDVNAAATDPLERERWEGVINPRPSLMVPVGGPGTTVIGTRVEIRESLSVDGFDLYLRAGDPWLHLSGGDSAILPLETAVGPVELSWGRPSAAGHFTRLTVVASGAQLDFELAGSLTPGIPFSSSELAVIYSDLLAQRIATLEGLGFAPPPNNIDTGLSAQRRRYLLEVAFWAHVASLMAEGLTDDASNLIIESCGTARACVLSPGRS